MNKQNEPKLPADNKKADLQADTVAPGEFLTTNQGLRINDDNNSLRAGERGPTLLEDFHFREKITHFDHERIPERIVHARGAAAHGFFQSYKPIPELTSAALFQDPSRKTPVFLRFSTVAGSRGSADTPRDVRGFAIKFYTDEGVWDLVGNNIPVFFIQDAVKFPDLIHSVKPEPHNEIPQAASAHDTFWDFASLQPESTHMLMWVMSDRALPRSLSRMQGFGIHTFRFVNAEGKARFVKFHFKPMLGVSSLVWDESQKLAGKDADFHRRDLFESIECGRFPEWEMGVQVIEEADEFKFDFDLLDPTKIVPEELVPVQPIGKITLNRNPDNFFAETEQVAFHPGHIVPGIDFTNDPLLQGRLFSYIDTQISRIGPNFAELPINRPLAPVSNNQRDGQMRVTINPGRVSYFPNSLGGGCPMHSPEGLSRFKSYAEKVDGNKIRVRSASFADHFSQATLFWNSMANWEKDHIVNAFSFELNKVDTKEVRERVVTALLANVDSELAQRVATNLGMKFSPGPAKASNASVKQSPALSIANLAIPSIAGRKVAILVADGFDAEQVDAMLAALKAGDAAGELIAPHGGTVNSSTGVSYRVDKQIATAASVFYDGVFVPGGAASVKTLSRMGIAVHFVTEAYGHKKTVGSGPDAVEFLTSARTVDGPGVIKGSSPAGDFVEALKLHRHYGRNTDSVPC